MADTLSFHCPTLYSEHGLWQACRFYVYSNSLRCGTTITSPACRRVLPAMLDAAGAIIIEKINLFRPTFCRAAQLNTLLCSKTGEPTRLRQKLQNRCARGHIRLAGGFTSPMAKTLMVRAAPATPAARGVATAKVPMPTKTFGAAAKFPAKAAARSALTASIDRPAAGMVPTSGKLMDPSGSTRTDRFRAGSSSTSICRLSPLLIL